MARIVRVKNRVDNLGKLLKTPRLGPARSGSFHDPAELTKRTRAKRTLRTLAAPFTGQQGGPGVALKTQGGSTNWKSSPAAKGLTDNPNAKFDPSEHPGAVSKKRAPILKVVNLTKGDRRPGGHGKEIKNPTRPTSVLGMKLKKR